MLSQKRSTFTMRGDHKEEAVALLLNYCGNVPLYILLKEVLGNAIFLACAHVDCTLALILRSRQRAHVSC